MTVSPSGFVNPLDRRVRELSTLIPNLIAIAVNGDWQSRETVDTRFCGFLVAVAPP